MINKNLAKKIIDKGLSTGADFVELYLENTDSSSINYDTTMIEHIDNTHSKGCGIRICKGERSVYGYTNELKEKDLIKLTQKLSSLFNSEIVCTSKEFTSLKVKKISHINKSFFLTPMENKISIVKTVSEYLKSYSPLISRATVSLRGTKTEIEIYNSNGLHAKDYKEYSLIVIGALATKDNIKESNSESRGHLGGLDFLDKLNLKEIANECAKDAIGMLDAKPCPGGKMPVILGNGTGGVLFHEACGHSLEATALAREMTTFQNRLNDKIASDIVTAYDDGTIPNAWGSNNIDDEGNKTQRICLIKNGILNSYLIDSFNGKKLKMPATGCARRESYKYEPTSRMSNTYIDNGKSSREEIFKNTKLGLYCKSFGGGSVNTATGEFQFGCHIAYIVRDGQIQEQVKGATLIGKCEDVLKNIDMIANDLDLDVGVCGSVSGWVPVRTGQPTLRIKKILVGGSKGELK